MTEPKKAGRKPAGKRRNATNAAPKKRLTDEQIAKALAEAKGLVTFAAELLEVERSTIYRRLSASPELREAVTEARESMKDVGESSLYKAVEAGESWAVCFFLKTQCKDRGYVERQEHDHSGNLNLGTPEQARERLAQAGVILPEGTP